jgi:hypothetical protein
VPNQNPIQLDSSGIETIYSIDQQFAGTMIFLTIKVELLSNGWQFASAHSIFLFGKDMYISKTPEPTDLKLDRGQALDGKKLSIRSHISRFRTDGPDTPPVVRYTLIIEAGDQLLDEFTKDSDSNNPSDFNSLIRFKLNS